MFRLNSRIPLVSNSSGSVAITAKIHAAAHTASCPTVSACPETAHVCLTAHYAHMAAATPLQPPEPILIPKLRIHFADFPYLRYSTWPEASHLGYLMRLLVRTGMASPRCALIANQLFTDHQVCTGQTYRRSALPDHHPLLRLIRFQGVIAYLSLDISVKKKRKLFPEYLLVSLVRPMLPSFIRHTLVQEF